MADRKISDLTALTAPAAGDYLPIVDISEVSAANKNKRITIEELLRGAPDGTAAAPSIGFESDPNTGIYRPGADQVAVATNGVERVEFGTSEVVFNDGGANYDFRIEGDTDANLFFVDASAERVGIGTASPGTKFQVRIATNKNIGFDLSDGEARLSCFDDAVANAAPLVLNGSDCRFEVSSNERARLDSSGRLLVGTSSNSGGALLQVNSNRIRVATAKTPASAADTGTAGEICWDADYIYVCTATNTWKRTAISTW